MFDFLSYLPFGIGAGMSLWRAVGIYQDQAGPISAAITANRRFAESANIIKSNLSASKLPTTHPSVLTQLGSLGISGFELTDNNLRIVDQLGSRSEYALFEFLNRPELNLPQDEIRDTISRIRSGSLPVSQVVQKYAVTGDRQQAFFAALAGTQTNPFSVFRSGEQGAFTLRGGGVEPHMALPFERSRVLSPTELTGVAKSRFQQLEQFGLNKQYSLFNEVSIHKVSVPGLYSRRMEGGKEILGKGYALYAHMQGRGFRATVPLDVNTFAKFNRPGGGRALLPVDVFHSGKEMQTLNVMSRFARLDPTRGAPRSYVEHLFWGRKGEGAPIVDKFIGLKSFMKSSDYGAIARELKGFYNNIVSPESGYGVYMPNMLAPGFRSEGVLRTQMVQMIDWDDVGIKDLPLEEKLILASRWGNIKAGAAPGPMEARGLFYIPSQTMLELSKTGEPFLGSFPQNRRMFQAWTNPHTVISENLSKFTSGSNFGPLGTNIKPWNRVVTPMMSGLGRILAGEGPSVYNMFTRFVIDPQLGGELGKYIGDGGLGLVTDMPTTDDLAKAFGLDKKLIAAQAQHDIMRRKFLAGMREMRLAHPRRRGTTQGKLERKMRYTRNLDRKQRLRNRLGRFQNARDNLRAIQEELVTSGAYTNLSEIRRQIKFIKSNQGPLYKGLIHDRTEELLMSLPFDADMTEDEGRKFARRLAQWEMAKKFHITPPGPGFYTEYSKTIARATGDITALEPRLEALVEAEGGWDALRKRNFRFKQPVEIMPGEILGTIKTATGLDRVQARRIFGQHKIIGLEPGGAKQSPMWKLTIGVDAPMQEMAKFFLGGKLVGKPYSREAYQRIGVDLGLGNSPNAAMVEAFTTTAELAKNPALLRDQQITALQMYAHRNKSVARRLLHNDVAWKYLVGVGTRVMGKTLGEHEAGLFGMMSTAQRLGLTPQEFGEVFGAEKLWSGVEDRLSSALGAGILTNEQAAAIRASKEVYGLLSLSPGKLSGEMTGNLGSMERRAWETLYKNLPDEIAPKVISDIASRLLIDRDAISLAREWFEQPGRFAKDAEVTNLVKASSADIRAIIDSDPFLPGTRRVFKLPDWVTGESKMNRLVLPSAEEMSMIEVPIAGSKGKINTPFRQSLNILLEQMAKDAETGVRSFADTGRGLAQSAFENVVQEQAAIHGRLYRSLFGSGGVKIAGSVYAHAGVRSPIDILGRAQDLNIDRSELEMTGFLSDYAFEKQYKSLKATLPRTKESKNYLKNLKNKFYKGEAYAGIGLRHPITGYHSAQAMFFRRAKGIVGDPGEGKYLASMYFVEPQAIVDGQLVRTSSWAAMMGDYDHDFGGAFMMRSAENERALYKHLQENKLELRKRVVEHALFSSKIESLWPSGGDDLSVNALRAAVGGNEEAFKFVKGASALGGIADVGRLTNSLAILEQASLGLSDVRPSPGVLSPRESFSLLTEKLAQAPISSKKYGMSLGASISERLGEIMASPGEILQGKEISSNAGSQVMEYLFGKGGPLEQMNMQQLYEGGININYALESGEQRSVKALINQDIMDNAAANLNEILNLGGRERMQAFQRKYPSYKKMSIDNIEKLRGLFAASDSPLYADMALASNQVMESMSSSRTGLSEFATHTGNLKTKLLAFSKSLRGKWHFISQPLLLGTLMTAGAYHVMNDQGYAKEPLTMPGEQLDPRIMNAIRSGDLLSGGNQGGLSLPALGVNDSYAVASRHNEAGYFPESGRYNQAMGQFSDRIYTASSRVSVQSNPNYMMNMRVNSDNEALAMAQHFQSHIPHARIGLTSHASPDYLRANRQDEYL